MALTEEQFQGPRAYLFHICSLPKLHWDARLMSSHGKNGAGWMFSAQLKDLNIYRVTKKMY